MPTRREFLTYAILLPFIGRLQFSETASTNSTHPLPQTVHTPRPWHFAKERGGNGLTFPSYFPKERPAHRPHKSSLQLVMRDG